MHFRALSKTSTFSKIFSTVFYIVATCVFKFFFMYSENENNHSTSFYSLQVTQMIYERRNCQSTDSPWLEISQRYTCWSVTLVKTTTTITTTTTANIYFAQQMSRYFDRALRQTI